MWKYFLRKLLLAIPLLLAVVTLIFVLVEISPGGIEYKFINPDKMTPEMIDAVRAKLGLDRPIYIRYLLTLKSLLLLDLRSLSEEQSVVSLIGQALPNTLLLSGVTLLVLYPFGVLMGTIQGVRHNTAVDNGISVVALLFYSMPSFWLGLMLQLLFALYFDALPSSGMKDPVMYDYMSPGGQLLDRLAHVILPGVAMGLAGAASIARYMRSTLLEVVRQDYIRTARSKGVPEWRITVKHAMRNALLPIVTLFGLSLPFLFSGSVLVEYVFAWPGMGQLIVEAIRSQDTPLIMGCFFVFTLVVVAGNLLADLLYAVVDPRIRYD